MCRPFFAVPPRLEVVVAQSAPIEVLIMHE